MHPIMPSNIETFAKMQFGEQIVKTKKDDANHLRKSIIQVQLTIDFQLRDHNPKFLNAITKYK